MNLMANPVSGTGKNNSEFPGDALQVSVVIGVFITDLDGVMIDVTYRQVGFHAGDAHGLELQISHRSGSVLRQSLIYADADFFTRFQTAADQVIREYFFNYIFSQWQLFLPNPPFVKGDTGVFFIILCKISPNSSLKKRGIVLFKFMTLISI